MCLAIPGKVIEINGNMALADLMGVQREVSIMLVENVRVGDYVIVHAGTAISKMDEDEALKTMEIFEELREFQDGK